MLRPGKVSATAGLLFITLSACNAPQVESTASNGISIPDQQSVRPETLAIKENVILCATDEPESLFSISPDHFLWQALGGPALASDGSYSMLPRALLDLPTPENGDLLRNQDGTLTVTLRYRNDLVWSDGQPFSAADTLLGFTAAQLPEVIIIQQIDPLTLQLTLDRRAAYPYVPAAPPLPSHVLGDLSPDQLVASDYARHANPTLGPYVMQEWTAGESITLAANPHYAGTAPRFSSLTVRFLPDGASLIGDLQSAACDVSIEGALSNADLLIPTQADLIRFISTPNLLWEHVDFNTWPDNEERTPFFADVRVRQAFAHTINRQELAASLASAPPLDSWLPPDHWAYPDDTAILTRYPHDPQRATALLAEAGWHDSDGDGILDYNGSGGEYSCLRGTWDIRDGTPFAVSLLTSQNDELRTAIASQIQADLQAIGVRLEIAALEPAALFSQNGPLVQRAFDMALFASPTTPEPHGDNWWLGADLYRHPLTNDISHDWQVEQRFDRPLIELLAATNIPSPANDYRGQNITGWCDEAANLAIYQATSTLSLPQRRAAYAQQQALFTRQLPTLSIMQHTSVVAHRPQICGLAPGPYAPIIWNINEWYFDADGACSS